MFNKLMLILVRTVGVNKDLFGLFFDICIVCLLRQVFYSV